MTNKSRIIAIDVGKKRIGIAQTDLLHLTASPVGTYSPGEVFTRLKKITDQESVERFIIGWPLLPSGDEGDAVHMVRSFEGELKKIFPKIPVTRMDERLTSVMAKEAIFQSGRKKKARRDKPRIDAVAAAILLESFLDEQR